MITLETFNGKKLSRSTTTERIDLLKYFSKTFSIITEREDHRTFCTTAYNEIDKTILEQTILEADLETAEIEFERLKTKYIFDYEKLLVQTR